MGDVRKKIVVVGSMNVDLVAGVRRMPAEGETVQGSGFATYPGGKGANQAVAAARLGGDVAMMGRVGRDDFGRQLRRGLEDAGVGTQCVLDADEPSGTAIILVTEEGHNSIVVVPGANDALRPEDLEEQVEVLRGAAVILAQLEIPMETVERLGAMAAEAGVALVLDPAPAQRLAPELLRCVTWLTPNESETRSLLESLSQPMGSLMEEDAVAMAAKRLLATGVRNVVLKLGERGVYLAGKDVAGTYVAGYRVKAVDTTAAGDAFNGGFAYGLTEGMTPVEAARFACGVAAVSVTRAGAQPSMPTLEEVRGFVGSVL